MDEYEQMRQNLMLKSSSRVYCSWQNLKKNLECKKIGLGQKCFCDHEFRQHEHLNPPSLTKVLCNVPKCPCRHFSYVPSQGNLDFKCNCGHSHKLHDPISRKCTFLNCGGCNRGFATTFICQLCRSPFSEHVLVFQTRKQLQQQSDIPLEQEEEELFKIGGIQNEFMKKKDDGPITDEEIQRRKGLPKQFHEYENGIVVLDKKTAKTRETIQGGEKLRIQEGWNLKTISLEENGEKVNVKKYYNSQQEEEEFKKSKKKNLEEQQKIQSKKDILSKLNEKVKEERSQIEQKYGFRQSDKDNEIQDLLDNNFIEEDQVQVGNTPALKLFYTPNKYALAAQQQMLKEYILEKAGIID